MFPLDLSYVWEKLFVTVLSLAAGEGTVRARLANAYISQFCRLDNSDMSRIPPSVVERIEPLLMVLREAYRPSQTTPIGDFYGIDDSAAHDLAEKIVSAYDHVCRHLEPLE